MKIGIIGAMDVEVDGIKEHIDNCSIDNISGIDFCCGALFGKDVVVAKSGEGKVNSAMAAQTMILKYDPDFVINTGVAGGLHKDMKVLDIAIADSVVQHDYDISPLGYEPGYVCGVDCVNIACDERLSNTIKDIVKDKSVFMGTIASGDQFIASNEQRNRIKNMFGAIASEMEGASIGHVCKLNNKPFTVLRVISDNADGSADMSFDAFAKKAANISIKIILEFVKNCK